MTTARELAMKGCHNFRAGVWKPRTKPGGFEGHGEPALVWMKQVKEDTKMLVSTEVATPEHVELCLKYGGGGHHNAGTCQLENDEVDKQLPDIIAALNA